jgi:outer membrane protein assembly factor BamB/tetratricopeptide (TPR) repeat protein
MTRRVKLFILPLFSGLLVISPCFAQQKNQIRFPLSEDLKLTLNQADRLLEKERHQEALDLYIEILRRDRDPKEPNNLFEIAQQKTSSHLTNRPRTFTSRQFIGASYYVQQKLKNLPAKIQDIYRERNDYRAKAEFNKAIEDGRERVLEQFYGEFAVSSYGPRALQRLANIAVERGSLNQANRCFLRLLKNHKRVLGAKEVRSLQRQRLRCLIGLGRLAEVRKLCDALSIRGKHHLSFGNRVLTRAQIEERTVHFKGAAAQERNKGISHIRGQTSHKNSYDAALWIGRPRFLARSFATVQRPKNNYNPYSPYRRRYNFNNKSSKRPSNSTLPIVLEVERRKNGVKVKEPIALLSTGIGLKTIWIKDGRDGPRILLPSSQYYVESHSKVLHGGAVSNQIFVTSFVSRVNNAENYKGIPIKVNLPVRKLAALDTRTWRWIWNHQDVLKNTPFAKASFPAPPIIVEGTVYASAIVIEGFVRSYVLAFDLYTGKLKWSTWICSGQVEQTMFGEHAREPMVLPVAVNDGKIFHCSSLGAMACLDARTGTPIWSSSYEQIEIEPPRGYYPVQRALGWANNPPIACDDVVIAAPLDSNFAVAFDARTGKRLWRKNRRRFNSSSEFEYLIGAGDGRVILTGDKEVACYELRRGRLLWKQDRFFNERIAGRGLIANGRVCLSIYNSGASYPARVSQYDLRTGKLVRTARTSGSSGGDLAMFGETILIMGRGLVSAFENKEPQRRTRDF